MQKTAVKELVDLSIIVPVYNEEACVKKFITAVKKELNGIKNCRYEIIFVDDGSVDNTYKILTQLASKDNSLKLIKFSRNFGKEYALMAGLKYCQGRAGIPMDVDLQDPPELIKKFVEKWQEGYDMVYGIRLERNSDTFIKRITAQMFYKIYNFFTHSPIPYNAGDYRLLDRKVINAILSLKERNIFMKGVFGWAGFKSIGINYSRKKRISGESKWGYWRLWNFALDGITASTTFPLRVWSYLGTILAFCGMLYALYIIMRTIMLGIDVPGYASLLVFILVLGGIQMIILGILGEYIGRIFVEVKRRPLYIIDDKVNFDND